MEKTIENENSYRQAKKNKFLQSLQKTKRIFKICHNNRSQSQKPLKSNKRSQQKSQRTTIIF